MTKLFRLIVPAPSNWNIYGHITGQTTSLGAIIVASAANKIPGWEVEVIDESNCKHRSWPPNAADGYIDHEALQRERPADLVGFYGSLSCTIPRVYKLAKLYKSMGAVTIAGGYHVRSEIEETLRNDVDFVCDSKGEECIAFLMYAISSLPLQGDIPMRLKHYLHMRVGFGNNRWRLHYLDAAGELCDFCTIQRNQIGDQDPVEPDPQYLSWDFGLLKFAKVKICPVMMRGGCPYNCEFCAVKDKPGKFIADHFVRQIMHLHERFGFKKFFIIDDHFGGNLDDAEDYAAIMECLKRLADYQKRIGKRFSFTCQIRLNACVDYRLAVSENKTLEGIDWKKYYRRDLMLAMRQAGIDNVCIGYESPIDDDLRRMHKGYLSKDMLNWTAIWHEFSFKIQGMFIFNYPKRREAIERLEEKCDVKNLANIYRRFIRQGRIDTVQILLPIPLPGTELRAWLQDEGRIFKQEDFDWSYYDGQFMLFDPLNCEPEEMQEAVKSIMGGFYHYSHLFMLAIYCLWHFPLLVFPATASLFALRVKAIRDAFRYWKREYWRNDAIRFGGSFIVRGFEKKYRESDIPGKLKEAKKHLASDS